MRLLDLIPAEGAIELAEGFSVEAWVLRKFLGDDTPTGTGLIGDRFDELLRELKGPPKSPTLSEKRAAKRLGVAIQEFREAAYELWGESLDEMVSREVGAEGSAQARGHATRRYVGELSEFLGIQSG